MVHCQCKHPRNLESTLFKKHTPRQPLTRGPTQLPPNNINTFDSRDPSLPLTNVEAAVNLRWDGANFCPQILLHPSQAVAIIISDQVNCQTEVAEPS